MMGDVSVIGEVTEAMAAIVAIVVMAATAAFRLLSVL